MKFSNLFVSKSAFKIGIESDGHVLKDDDAQARDGDLLVTGKARGGKFDLRVSQVVSEHLVDIKQLSTELQLKLLQRVKSALQRFRSMTVFFYEAAFWRASLKTQQKTASRLQTLGHEVQRRHKRVSEAQMYQLGARATVAA